MLKEGDRVPEFQAAGADGAVLGSSGLAGRRYAVYFYPRDFTPGCTTEADEFAQMYGRFQEMGVEIVGVSPDGEDSHRRFCDKMNIRFPLLSDADKKIARAFGVWGPKKFMGREYEGVTRSTFLVGADGIIFKAYPRVRPAGHAAQVLADFADRGEK